MATEYLGFFQQASPSTSSQQLSLKAHAEQMRTLQGRFSYCWKPPKECSFSFPALVPSFVYALETTPGFRLILETKSELHPQFHITGDAYTQNYLVVPRYAKTVPLTEKLVQPQPKAPPRLIKKDATKELNPVKVLQNAPKGTVFVSRVVLNQAATCHQNIGSILHTLAHELFGHVNKALRMAKEWHSLKQPPNLAALIRRYYTNQEQDHASLVMNDNFPEPDQVNETIIGYLRLRYQLYKNVRKMSRVVPSKEVWNNFNYAEYLTNQDITSNQNIFKYAMPNELRWWDTRNCDRSVLAAYDPEDVDRLRYYREWTHF